MTTIQALNIVAMAGLIPAITWLSWRKGRHGGRPYAAIGAALIAALSWHPGLGLVDAACMGLAWALWRTLPPKMFGESVIPKANALGPCIARHSLAFAFLWPLRSVWFVALPALAVFVAAAVLLARRHARHETAPRIGEETEMLQGLALSVAVAVSAVTMVLFGTPAP